MWWAVGSDGRWEGSAEGSVEVTPYIRGGDVGRLGAERARAPGSQHGIRECRFCGRRLRRLRRLGRACLQRVGHYESYPQMFVAE